MTAALTASDLVVRRGRREIVHGVDLAVAPGEIVVVLGPNGAGKSTLLGALGGLLRPAGGSVTSTGRVATVLQTPSLARRSAYANVKLATAWAGVARAERAERARAAMRLMRVDHLSSRPARTLSGGEQRRVHLARALAVAPDVLLLDEPFDGLDPETHETLREDAVAALRRAGTAAVFVLHDRRDAWAVADRLAVLVDGRFVAVGPVDDVVERPPTPEVARLLGFDGVLVRDGVHTHTRPAHVRLVEHGPWQATVERRYLTESGLRLGLRSADGSVWTQHPSASGFAVGDAVSFELVGGVDFDADTDADPADEPRMTR